MSEAEAKKAARKKARVLVDTSIGGTAYKANDVANEAAEAIDAAVKQGIADDNAAAVTYAESQTPKKEEKKG